MDIRKLVAEAIGTFILVGIGSLTIVSAAVSGIPGVIVVPFGFGLALLAAIAVALTGWLLALEALRRWGTRAAWLAGILFVLGTVAFAPQDGQAANFEIFMLLPMTAGVVLAARRRPASAIPSSRASRRPTCCPTAARSNRSAPIPAWLCP